MRWLFVLFLAWDVLGLSQVRMLRKSRGAAAAALSMAMGDEKTAGSFFYSQKDFEGIGVSEDMVRVLGSLNLVRPSKVQALSFKDILSGKHTILADQTGSGRPWVIYCLRCNG